VKWALIAGGAFVLFLLWRRQEEERAAQELARRAPGGVGGVGDLAMLACMGGATYAGGGPGLAASSVVCPALAPYLEDFVEAVPGALSAAGDAVWNGTKWVARESWEANVAIVTAPYEGAKYVGGAVVDGVKSAVSTVRSWF
jgi:hypothetical protein